MSGTGVKTFGNGQEPSPILMMPNVIGNTNMSTLNVATAKRDTPTKRRPHVKLNRKLCSVRADMSDIRYEVVKRRRHVAADRLGRISYAHVIVLIRRTQRNVQTHGSIRTQIRDIVNHGRRTCELVKKRLDITVRLEVHNIPVIVRPRNIAQLNNRIRCPHSVIEILSRFSDPVGKISRLAHSNHPIPIKVLGRHSPAKHPLPLFENYGVLSGQTGRFSPTTGITISKEMSLSSTDHAVTLTLLAVSYGERDSTPLSLIYDRAD